MCVCVCVYLYRFIIIICYFIMCINFVKNKNNEMIIIK